MLTRLGSNYILDRPSGLVWTLKQLSYLARTECTNTAEQSLVRECVFKLFAAFGNFVKEGDQLRPFLKVMLEPLFRTEDSEDSSEEVSLQMRRGVALKLLLPEPAIHSHQ